MSKMTTTTVRLPDKLRGKIQAEADFEHRTFTSQVTHILEQHYKAKEGK